MKLLPTLTSTHHAGVCDKLDKAAVASPKINQAVTSAKGLQFADQVTEAGMDSGLSQSCTTVLSSLYTEGGCSVLRLGNGWTLAVSKTMCRFS